MLEELKDLLRRLGTELMDMQSRLDDNRRLAREVSNGDAGWYAVDGLIRDLDRPVHMALDAYGRACTIVHDMDARFRALAASVN